MKQLSILLSVLILGLTPTACGSVLKPVDLNSSNKDGQTSSKQLIIQTSSQDMTLSDTQGAVTFAVKPDNLSELGDELIFEISMNTHSIDLSMDLATLATLYTDNGNTVLASSWDAPRGGHHVSGTLSFPASVDGKSFLDGATKITLTIKNVDAPERIFTWALK